MELDSPLDIQLIALIVHGTAHKTDCRVFDGLCNLHHMRIPVGILAVETGYFDQHRHFPDLAAAPIQLQHPVHRTVGARPLVEGMYHVIADGGAGLIGTYTLIGNLHWMSGFPGKQS